MQADERIASSLNIAGIEQLLQLRHRVLLLHKQAEHQLPLRGGARRANAAEGEVRDAFQSLHRISRLERDCIHAQEKQHHNKRRTAGHHEIEFCHDQAFRVTEFQEEVWMADKGRFVLGSLFLAPFATALSKEHRRKLRSRGRERDPLPTR